MKASWKIWRETLKLAEGGVKPTEWPHELRPTTDGATLEQLGFYRLPKKEPKLNAQGHKNGQWKTVGYETVAVTVIEGELAIFISGYQVPSRGEGDSSFLTHPISEDVYRAVAERGEPWPYAADVVPAANRDVTKADNDPPAEVETPATHATAIENAKAAAPKTVTNAEEAATAAGSMNRLAELRLACTKAGEAIYKPLHAIYSKSQKEWTAPVKVAEAEEKRLLIAVKTWQESERKRLAKEAEEAAAKLDVAATPAPVAAPAPIVATYGTRAVKAEPKLWAVMNDYALALAHFHEDAELRARVEKLATDAVRAGKTVPGVTTREGVI